MIALLDRDSGEAWLEVAHGVNLEGMEISYQMGEGITGKVAQTGRPMAIPNLGREALFLDRTGARRSLNRDELPFCVFPFCTTPGGGHPVRRQRVQNVTSLDRELALLSSVAELIAKAVHILALEEENRACAVL